GKGSGSGSGKGKGSAEPDPDAVDGPGLTTSPPPPQPPRPPSPPQPPPVVMKSVKVCSVSGLLPGAHCERKETKSFKTGSEPKRQCGMCKAPEPKHVSTLADVAEPVLVKDYEPNIPDIDEPGDYTVKLEYTVGTEGNVSNVKVVSSCGIKAIDKAVVDAAKKIRYRPAVQNGQPRSVNIKRTYKIRI
ncbi:MAG TPA: energy transducer TonB, partial [Armatimonadota bacterium]|nr:energy transducer TonB [Armatimonadota bacterium]